MAVFSPKKNAAVQGLDEMEDREKELLQQTDDELRHAMAAKKCWRCGCFQDTVNTLQSSDAIHGALGPLLEEAHTRFEPKRYECLGCDICRIEN